MAVVANIAKKPLETTTMYNKHHIFDRRLVTHIRARWNIPDFDKLKDNIRYTSLYEPYDWTFSLIKKRKSLTVTIDMKRSNQSVECCIPGDKTQAKRFVEAEESNEGAYDVKFQTEGYGRKCFMLNGTLVLEFKISQFQTTILPLSTRKRAEYDQEYLLCDLTEYLLNLEGRELYQNFVIHSENSSFPLHKSILSVRSKFFSDYFKKHPKSDVMNVCTPYCVIRDVLYYTYFGEIQLMGDWDYVRDVLELAINLRVTGLQSVITHFLQQTINKKNVQDVKELGMETEIETLVQAADSFLDNDEGKDSG